MPAAGSRPRETSTAKSESVRCGAGEVGGGGDSALHGGRRGAGPVEVDEERAAQLAAGGVGEDLSGGPVCSGAADAGRAEAAAEGVDHGGHGRRIDVGERHPPHVRGARREGQGGVEQNVGAARDREAEDTAAYGGDGH